jgi:hypothetical protein
MNTDTLNNPPIRNVAPRSKTLAAWLALVGGPLGWHRLYLYGWQDMWAWVHAIPTALGLWGVDRVLTHGQDDKLSWLLLPLLGISIAVACLTAIVYALRTPEQWNAWHNPTIPADSAAGRTHWLTIGAMVFALMWGAIGLMGSLAFGFQRYFEYQIEEGLKISQ